MCRRCDEATEALKNVVVQHSKDSNDGTTCGNDCAIPRASGDYTQTAWWHLATAHALLGAVLDRIERSRELFDKPEQIPASLLSEWEEHLNRAGVKLATMRVAKESERADDRRVQ